MRKPDKRFSEIDSVFSGFILDTAKCSQLSLGEKRELVHTIVHHPNDALALLRSWTRRELLEVICAEMGKERKYTGFTKFRMIEHLLKLVSKKYNRNDGENSMTFPTKLESMPADPHNVRLENVNELLCRNLACRASLCPEDAFCKRCSCCICYRYDDNKDPSLWLTCNSDPPTKESSCGMTCHLNCALRFEKAGIVKNGSGTKLDGQFSCVSCGKINGLMRTWRKQLVAAKEARRVDVLCSRILLSHQILDGTAQYKELHEIVKGALEKLKHEVGTLDQACQRMGRTIVNRLSCGAEVQKLCASAIETFDSTYDVHYSPCLLNLVILRTVFAACKIRIEECSPVSTLIVLECKDGFSEETLGCKLWHKKSTEENYPEKPTYMVLSPERRFKIVDLNPLTNYICKVSLFSSTTNLGIWEAKWATPATASLTKNAEKDNTLLVQNHSKMDSTNPKAHPVRSLHDIYKKKNEGFHLLPPPTEVVPLVTPLWVSPSTPCKCDGLGRKKQDECNYDYSVRAVRWLEVKGHINNEFRVRFLTWFSLKATKQERRVVSAFVDTLIDDPPCLAGQLIDTFAGEIYVEKKPGSEQGFCSKL